MSEIHDYLRELIDAGTRSDPLVFVGRRVEADKISRIASNPPPDGPRSCTILMMGAPGSGKTSLLFHLARKLEYLPETGVLLYEDIPDDDEVATVYGRIAANLVGAAPPSRRGDAQKTVSGGFSLGVVRGEGTSSERLSLPTFHSAAEVADARDGNWGPKKRLVVFVDEIQNIEPGSAAAKMLLNLHTQAKIPVLLVCAGLSNSEIALGEAGLSRIENNLHIGALSEDETLACARESIDTVRSRGVAGSDAVVARWASALAQASDNWPRHLQMYLHAGWRALLGQHAPNLDSADLEAVLHVGNADRARYYETRIEASDTPLEVIVALHGRMGEKGELDQFEARRIIGREIDGLDARVRNEWAARFDDNTGKCFAQLLKTGIVSLNGMKRCQSPVPSFSNYILDRKAGELSDGRGLGAVG